MEGTLDSRISFNLTGPWLSLIPSTDPSDSEKAALHCGAFAEESYMSGLTVSFEDIARSESCPYKNEQGR